MKKEVKIAKRIAEWQLKSNWEIILERGKVSEEE